MVILNRNELLEFILQCIYESIASLSNEKPNMKGKMKCEIIQITEEQSAMRMCTVKNEL